MVSVSVVEPPDAILATPKVLLMLGGCTAAAAVNGLVPVLPAPPLVEVTLPVTLGMAPAVVLVTSTVMAQLPLAGMLLFLMIRRPPRSALLAYTTLFRSVLLKFGVAATLRL